MRQNMTDASDSLSSIGITINSNGTLTVNEDTLESALSSDASSVASTLSGLASTTKASASGLVSGTLTQYTESFKQSMSSYTKLNQDESGLELIGLLFDSKS